MIPARQDKTPHVLVIQKNLFDDCISLTQVFQTYSIDHNPGVIECVIPADSKVKIVDDLRDQNYEALSLRLIVKENAFIEYEFKETSAFSNHDKKSSNAQLEREITVVLDGSGADAQVRCFYFGNASDMLKIKTLQEHNAPHATSNVVIKAVLDDKAKLVCRSMITVALGAHGTHAEQVNKNVLLSRNARAISVPMLEVLANDVQCKHGAAVSALDAEHFFYLQSRGLSRDESQQILLESFLS